jgi:CRP-like cAMP-binding protein
MALDDRIALLGRAPLFSLLDRDALRLIAFAADERELRAGEILFRKGERSDGGYVVTRGAIALDLREDGSAPVFVGGPGALIGQAALFGRIARPATAVARESSATLRISPTLVRRVLEEFPATARKVRDSLDEDLAELSDGLDRVRRQFLAIDEPA